MTTQAPVDRTETFADLFNAICTNIETAIRGKREVVHLATMCLIANGHLLLEDAPGVGKTSLAKALASSVDCSFGRVQFTPDLLPSDVLGTVIYNHQSGTFTNKRGPIFTLAAVGVQRSRTRDQLEETLRAVAVAGPQGADRPR